MHSDDRVIGQSDDFADDFDDFEEGAEAGEDDDFGDFGDTVQPVEDDGTDVPPTATSLASEEPIPSFVSSLCLD